MRTLSKDKAVYLQALAGGGDMVAKAILELATDFTISAGTLAGGVIPVTGQLVDGAGNPVLKSADVLIELETASAGSIAVVTGTSKLATPEQVWLKTTAQGLFVVNVSNPTGGELSLLVTHSPDGVTNLTELQF